MPSGIGFSDSGVFTSPSSDLFKKAFQEPTTSLREAEERRIENQRNQQAEDTNQRTFSSSSLDTKNQGNQKKPIEAVAQFQGRPLDQIPEKEEPSNFRGGSTLDVKGGEVTLKTSGEDSKSIKINSDDNVRVARNDEGTLSIVNKSTNEKITVESGEQLNVSGQGSAILTGNRTVTQQSENADTTRTTTQVLEFQSGETISVQGSGQNLSLNKPSEARGVQLSNDNSVRVSGDEAGDTFTLTNNAGESISFQVREDGGNLVGDTGTITRNDDGSITVKNKVSGETATFSSAENIQTGTNDSDVSATVTNQQTSGSLELEGSQSLSLQQSGDTASGIVNQSSAPAASVSEAEPRPQANKPLQLRILSNPENEQLETLNRELIQRPAEEQREKQRQEQLEEQEEALSGQAKNENTQETQENEREQSTEGANNENEEPNDSAENQVARSSQEAESSVLTGEGTDKKTEQPNSPENTENADEQNRQPASFKNAENNQEQTSQISGGESEDEEFVKIDDEEEEDSPFQLNNSRNNNQGLAINGNQSVQSLFQQQATTGIGGNVNILG